MHYKNLSTFNLASILVAALSTLPERHFVAGSKHTARRFSGIYPPENTNGETWKEYKTLTAAKAALTRRAKCG